MWAKSPKRQGGLNRNRGALSPEIRGRIQPKYAPKWPEGSLGNGLWEFEGVSPEEVDVLEGKRRDPGDVGGVDRPALAGELVQCGLDVGGVPQGDDVEDQAKGAELSDADVHQATRDSVRALMLIRAYRMRGHFHAKLDPLGIEAPRDREELDPRSYGFTEADFDRKIFLDHVLGLEYGTLREIVQICERTYCQTLGVEFMHISNAAQKAWIQERIEGPDKEISFTPEGRRAILNKLIEADEIGRAHV